MSRNYEQAAELLLNQYELDQAGALAAAQVHAILALVDELRRLGPWIKEIGDQLDTMPRRPTSVVPQSFTYEELVGAFDKIRHEAGHSRDTKTRRRLTEALAVLAPFMDTRSEMATTGTIPDAEATS